MIRGITKRILTSEYLILILCVVYFVVMAVAVPGFGTWLNLRTVLAYLLPVLVASIGLTLVLITAGIDLSITSIIALTSVLGGRLMSGEDGWLAGHALAVPVAVLAMLALGMALGAVNGYNIAVLRMPPFMATLILMMFGSGLAIWWTQSRKLFDLPAGFTLLARNLWVEALVVLAAAVFAHVALSRTLYGRWIYAIGHNAKTALISGVPVGWVLFWTYVASGLFAGLSSILFTASLETGDPEMARNSLLDIIGATVIGGTSLYGGKGKVLWTIYGVVFLALIDNSLNLMGLTFFFITMIKGAVILLAALLDAARHEWMRA